MSCAVSTRTRRARHRRHRGGRGFRAGTDLGTLREGAAAVRAFVPAPEDLPLLVLRLRTPVVTAVNGPVAGVGFACLLGSDVRFAPRTATMSTTFAREAAALGLVHRVREPGRLSDDAVDYAGQPAAHCSPASTAAVKEQVYGDLDRDADTAVRRALLLMDAPFDGPDRKEALAARIEKRSPSSAPLPGSRP